MKLKYILVLLIALVLILPNISAWSINFFNNSATTETLNFTAGQNITRYIDIPDTVGSLLNAFLNITAYTSNSSLNNVLARWQLNEIDDSNLSDDFGLYNFTYNTTGGSNLSIIADGLFGNVLQVNNTGDVGEYTTNGIPNNLTIGRGNEKTWSLWFNLSFFQRESGSGSIANLFGNNLGGESNDTFIRYHSAQGLNITQLIFEGITTTDGNLHVGITNPTSEWVHIAFAWNDSTVFGYRDGQLVNSTTDFVPGTPLPETVWSVGDVLAANVNITFSIADVRVYNSTLSALEISRIYDEAYLNQSSINLTIGGSYNEIPLSTNGTTLQTYRTGNLRDDINNYINSCNYVNNICSVPFIFSSQNQGNLTYSQLIFDNQGIKENNQSFVDPVYDTQVTSFSINLSYDSSFYNSITGVLNYNGTLTSGTVDGDGDNVIIKTDADIKPLSASEERSFFWQITLSNQTGQEFLNSTIQTHDVNPSTFIQCGVGETAVNYTVYDEDTLQLINSSFEATFDWKLNQSSDFMKNASFDLIGFNNYQFCINSNETYYTDVEISLAGNENVSYSNRQFGFNQEEFNNETKHVELYLLNSSRGTDVIIEVKDVGLLPVSDHTIKIYRKIESTGERILVENDITDEFGQIVAKLIENDVRYKLEFYDESNILVKTVPDALVTCSTDPCKAQFIVDDNVDLFEDFDDIDDHSFTLAFSNSTNITSLAWVDNTGGVIQHRLFVQRILFNGTTTVCNVTSSASSGILSCDVGSSRASYRIQAFRSVSGDENRIGLINVDVGNLADRYGLEGLYWSFILSMIMILVGRFYPPVGIVLYLFGSFLLSVLDIVFINPAIMIAQIVIGGLFIWAFRG